MGLNDMLNKRILSAHHFDSDWDYYDQFLDTWEHQAYDAIENGIDEDLIDMMIVDHYDEIVEYLIDKDFAFEWLCKYYKTLHDWNKEP